MSKKELLAAIFKLPTEDQIALRDEIDQRLPTNYIAPDESPELIAELDRRLAARLLNPSRARTWDQVSRNMKAAIRKVREDRSTSKSSLKQRPSSSKRRSNTK